MPLTVTVAVILLKFSILWYNNCKLLTICGFIFQIIQCIHHWNSFFITRYFFILFDDFFPLILCTDSFPNICVEIVSDCPTVFRVEATWDLQLGEREVENIRNCQFLCRVRLCCVRSQECCTLHSHQAGLIVFTCLQNISLAWRTSSH